MTLIVPDEVLLSFIIIIAFPILAGVLAAVLKKKICMIGVVALNTVLISAASLYLLWYMNTEEASTLYIGAEWFGFSIHEIILYTDLLLLAGFVVLGLYIKNYAVVGLGALQIGPLAYFEMTYPNASEGILEISFTLDYLALTFVLICSLIGSLIAIYAVEYMRKDRNRGPFFFFLLLFLGAMNGAVLSNNILYLYFFWEVTTLCCYYLIRHDKTKVAQKNAEWALVVTMAGGAALLAGVFMFANYAHTLAINEVLNETGEALLALPVFLFVLAAFTKSAQVPFESWLTGAMVAPSPVSALLHSSTMVKLGVYLILRMEPLLHEFNYLALFVGFVGAFSFASTAALAIQETQMKKVLAYSTIGNLGLIMALTAMGTPESIAAALILTIFHAISKCLLFLSVGVVQHEFHTKEIEGVESFLQRSPTIATVMIIGMLTMFLIPFGVFVGKYIAIGQSSLNPLFILLIAVGSISSEVFYVKWIGRMLAPSGKKDKRTFSSLYTGPLYALLGAAIALTALLPALISILIDPIEATGGTDFVMDYIVFSPASWGWIPMSLALLILLIIGLYKYMDKEGEPATIYACGVPHYDTSFRGEYFTKYFNQDWVNLAMDVIAIHILVLCLAAAAYGAELIPEVF